MDNYLRYGDLWAVCHACRHKHLLPKGEAVFDQAWQDWHVKHAGHAVALAFDLSTVEAMHGQLAHNADVKTAYAASAAYTLSLASLATAANLDAGRESTAVSNASNKYLDEIIGGTVMVGTTPTVNTIIEVWGYGAVNDTPTYPDVLDGTDSAETFTHRAILVGSCWNLAVLDVPTNTSDRAYWMRPTSLVEAMRLERPPTHHGLFITHNTGVNLNATGGNHAFHHTPIYATVV